ncbi:expressed unknown protein [Seminavis robusta]|uniref:ENTH domain-containing protein n=1 Tax=Seminavis robusta TaxID=568900 RepID=A0A9N8DGU5_9STRA|nr:expressed unknown protein [Seminavis robusta]|eukprot:Sro152_g069360.1 n/a (620) ;mRNA; f:14429-16379
MRFTTSSSILLLVAVALVLLDQSKIGAVARKPSRPSRGPPPRRGPPPSSRRPSSRRRPRDEDEGDDDDDDDAEEDILGFADDSEEEEEEEEEEYEAPRPSKRRPPPKSSSRPPSRKRPPPPREYDMDEEDEYDDYEQPRRPSRKRSSGGSSRNSNSRKGPPSRRGPPSRPSKVVPYGRGPPRRRGPSATEQAAATFSRGWNAFASVMPDPATVKDGVASSISTAREATSALSGNLYREVKGLTSSELEQVMLKATRPDDTPVKGKHVERLVGVTYQISPRYDIYDAVLRKLWGKMAEKDWRTTIKALYILHRFSADGAPEHAQALKARLRELRRTKDPKRKDKYFNSKQMLAGDSKPENIKYRAFMARYSHFVLLRAQCFGGIFDEISQKPAPAKRDKKGKAPPKPKPITSTNLRVEHLDAAKMMLKAGVACQLKDGEECENTAIAAERVASDMIGLTTATAIALNRALKSDDSMAGADPAVIRRWCEFYSEELLPQTRAMVKKTSARLDAFGLFLPSRMGASLSPETLEKGLKAEEWAGSSTTADDEEEVKDDSANKEAEAEKDEEEEEEIDEKEEEPLEEEEEEAKGSVADEAAFDEGDAEYDEYEYDEEEYYDDEG